MANGQIDIPAGFTEIQRPQGNQPIPQGFTEVQRPQDDIEQLMRQATQQLPAFVPRTTPPPGVGPLTGGMPFQASRQFQQQRTTEARQGVQSQIDIARQSLISKGFSQEDIKQFADINKATNRFPVGRTAGGIAGGIAAPLALGQIPPFTVLPEELLTVPLALAAAGGAGLGGAAGEAAQVALEEKRMITRREGLNAFGKEAVAELAGRGVAGGLKRVFSPLVKQVVPEAAELIDDFAKFGGQFEPQQLDDRLVVKIGQEIARGGFGGKSILAKSGERNTRAAIAYADSIVDEIAQGVARSPKEEIGQIFAAGISKPNGRIFNIMDDLFDPLYTKVDDLAGTGTVSTKGLKEFRLKKLAENRKLLKPDSPDRNILFTAAGKDALDDIDALPDVVSFGDMRRFRSKILKDARKLGRDVDQSEGMIKQISSITTDAIFDPASAKGITDEARRLLKNTNSLYSAAQEGIQNVFPERLAKRLVANPSNVIRQAFPNQNPTAIKSLRESLVRPVGGKPSTEGKLLWDQLRKGWLEDAIEDSTRSGKFNRKVFDTKIRRLGPEAVNEMYSSAERQKIESIDKLFGVLERGSEGSTLLVKSAQGAGAFSLYRGLKEGSFMAMGTGGAMIFGPGAFARLSIHPVGSKILTAGVKKATAKGIGKAATFSTPQIARMITILREEDRREAEIREKARLVDMIRSGQTPEQQRALSTAQP